MIDNLSDSALFPVLEEEYLQNLEACGTILKLEPHQILFNEGETARCFYVVLDGQIKITKQLSVEKIVVTIHRQGEFTGDLSTLTGGVSQATATSIDVSRVIQFDDFVDKSHR